jgi:methylthioribose-1-phosphate isomerase
MSIDRRSFIRAISGQAVRSLGAAAALSAEIRRDLVDQLRDEPLPSPLPGTGVSIPRMHATIPIEPTSADDRLGLWADIPPIASHLTAMGTLEFVDQRELPGPARTLEAVSVSEVVDWMRVGALDGGLCLAQTCTQAAAMAAIAAGTAPRVSTLAVVRGAIYALTGARPDVPLIATHLAACLADDGIDGPFDPVGSDETPVPLAMALRRRADAMADEARDEHRRSAARGADWLHRQFGDRARLLLVGETGPVSTATIGTTSAIIRTAAERGQTVEVLVPDGEPRGRSVAILADALRNTAVSIESIADASVGRQLASKAVDIVLMHASFAIDDGSLVGVSGSLAAALLANEAGVHFVGVATPSMVTQTAPGPRAHSILGPDAGSAPLEIVPARLISAVLTDSGPVAPGAMSGRR